MIWKPTLAATLPMTEDGPDWSVCPLPVLASPKIDGVRAMVQSGKIISRSGREFRNQAAQDLFGCAELNGLDGELTIGRPNAGDVFNRTARCLSSGKQGAYELATGALRFNVFDSYGESGLLDRVAAMRSNGTSDKQSVYLVKQRLIKTLDKLEDYERRTIAEGYEGIMLRRADAGGYMTKRSTLREFVLVKVKRFEYAEATIIAAHPLQHNLNTEKTATGKRSTKKSGVVTDPRYIGSATLKDCKTGVEFNATVDKDALRAWTGWQDSDKWRGVKVRYKYQLCGTINKPRILTCTFKELLG